MVLSAIAGALMVAQLVLLFIIGRDHLPALKLVGYASWLGGAVLGWLPVLVFRRRGGVGQGRSYVHTTRVVRTGIYSVVRHPQYLSFYFLVAGLILIGQHWSILALGIVAAVLFTFGLRGADERNLGKFGEEYRDYMKQVPGYNILWGFIRRLRRPGDSG